jgi:PAS domain S-box-containing protein
VCFGIAPFTSSCWYAALTLAMLGGGSLAGVLAGASPDATRPKGGIARRIFLLFVTVAGVLLAEAVVVDHFITEAERYDASVSLASSLDADSRVIALTASGVPAATSVESGNRSIGALAANDLKEAMTRFDRALAVLGNGGSLGSREFVRAPAEISDRVEVLGAVWAKARPLLETVAASPEGLVSSPPELTPVLVGLRQSSARLVTAIDSRDDALRKEVRYAAEVAIFAGLGALLLSFTFAWNRVVVPMRRLHEQALGVVELPPSSRPMDEVEGVSRAVTEMVNQRDGLRQERARMTEKLRRAEADYQSIFDNAVAGILRFDDEGKVMLANDALAKMLGFESAVEVEASVSDVHRQLFEDPQHRASFEDLHRKRGRVELESKARRKDGTTLWVLESSRAAAGRDGRIVYEAVVVDITAMKKAQESLRELSGLLLRSQDSERRRIARELHDSTGQLLAALEINFDKLDELVPVLRETVSSSVEIASECNRQIRSMSYLLHPPMLEELGLLYALRDYCRGFSARSKIDVVLDTPPELARLDSEAELAMFRVVQESLTNIQRHAESPDAIVRIQGGPSGIRLEVEDHGRGIRPELLGSNSVSGLANMGVGMRGMEERLRQLGGRLTIESERGRTTVRAELPQTLQGSPA